MTDCDRCYRYFNSWSAYHQHVRDSSNHWECEDCQIDFGSWLGRKEHYVQSPDHDYCQYCDVHFNYASELEDHYEDEHAYCRSCRKVFKNDFGLHEHNRQKHADVYCIACKRLFQAPSNLHSHLNSSVHRPKDTICPFNGCGMAFINKSALILHLESGSCQSGVNRRMVDNWVRTNDRSNMITNPARLITAGERANVSLIATQRSWNGRAFECVLCHTQFKALTDLNRHLASPRHQEKVYRCPLNTCQTHFASLSGLCQHIESQRCGVTKFRAVRDAMDNLFSGVTRIAM
ncbi:hypothetical protein DEU56DRAFT_831683 [Suillus clintonianus]|uniref:uncharacterized protein n=1 Tax=Suillus clintonianus TaxID=1904413 RepID=UPI001B85DABD|nr:uncharacterized protein DEU56DRAFT_831683 [Suillus clintonianus]KAG2122575.1 hypothetical protein DEU56DRAFT_831683 [Suillus clintonianus]